MKIIQTKFYEIFQSGEGKKRRLFTKNLVAGKSVYGERLISENGIEYREWDMFRSKLAAFIMKGADQIALKPDDFVLYLGAATGTTASHVSDIVGRNGFVFAIDFAPRVVRELIFLAADRKNIAPLLADANQPLSYLHRVCQVDFLYQDVAQANQVGIFIKNAERFLKHNGFAMLALKARSIDVVKKPKIIFRTVKEELEEYFTIVDARTLEPFEMDHCMFLCKKG